MDTIIKILGYMAAICIPLAFLPQTIKIIKTKNVKGLSLISYSIYQLGLILFIIYAAFKDNVPLLLPNIFGTIVNIILLILIVYNLYYQKQK